MHLFYSTFKNQDEAIKASEYLLNKNLIKCCNILSNDSSLSLYKWNGEVQKESETYVLFKVARSKKDFFITELEKTHPYDTPCIIEIKTDFINQAFEEWVNQEV